MKRKQFVKGINQDRPGRRHTDFQEYNTGMEEDYCRRDILQSDVLKYRLNNEYNVEIRLEPLPMNISAG